MAAALAFNQRAWRLRLAAAAFSAAVGPGATEDAAAATGATLEGAAVGAAFKADEGRAVGAGPGAAEAPTAATGTMVGAVLIMAGAKLLKTGPTVGGTAINGGGE